jgi:hypothetical protein
VTLVEKEARMKLHEESTRWFTESGMDSKRCPVCGSHNSYQLLDPGEADPHRESREYVFCKVCGLVLSFLGAITAKRSH